MDIGEFYKSIEEVEDKYVIHDVIPLIRQAVEKAISQLRSPIRITISHTPGSEISIEYSRIHQGLPKPEAENKEDAAVIKEEMPTNATNNIVKPEKKSQKRVSVGFTVKFADGTVFHESKAVRTWIKALKKIGLEFLYNNRNSHKAWHQVEEKDICIVERTEVLREKNVSPPQKLIDGFYVLRQLSNEQKVKDLRLLAEFLPDLGIQVEWDGKENEQDNVEQNMGDEDANNTNDSDKNEKEQTDDSDNYLVKNHTVNGFVFDVVKQLYQLDKLESIKPYFRRNQLIGVAKDGDFNLIGMFISCSYDELLERNSKGSTRWFDTPFDVDGDTLYLSNQWVDKNHGSLRLQDFRRMVAVCYHELLEVQILFNGTYVLKEL